MVIEWFQCKQATASTVIQQDAVGNPPRQQQAPSSNRTRLAIHSNNSKHHRPTGRGWQSTPNNSKHHRPTGRGWQSTPTTASTIIQQDAVGNPPRQQQAPSSNRTRLAIHPDNSKHHHPTGRGWQSTPTTASTIVQEESVPPTNRTRLAIHPANRLHDALCNYKKAFVNWVLIILRIARLRQNFSVTSSGTST